MRDWREGWSLVCKYVFFSIKFYIMTSYSHFTLEAIEAQFGIKNRMMPLFNSIKEIPVSDFLQRLLNNVAKLPMKSEKARSEMVVFPILLELRDLQNNFFTIYSGDTLNVDAERGLRGECDFIIAKDTGSLNVNAPIFQVVEAKKMILISASHNVPLR